MANKAEARSVCEMCHCRCRVLVHSENERLVKIEEDCTDPRVDNILPPTRGCLRLQTTAERLYHPDRINYPLKRAGTKGEGKWQRISWEQAFDEIAERLQEIKDRHGVEALAIIKGTARMPHHFIDRFMHAFGSPNTIGQSQICYGPDNAVSAAMYGWTLRTYAAITSAKGSPGQIVTKCMMIIGAEYSQSMGRLWKSIRAVKESGGKIVVVDPRRAQTGELADVCLQLRPGTDAAVLMAMINVIIEEGLYDKDFVANWCYGFDKLTERALDYSPEKVSEIAWVPPEKIREAARLYATNKPAFIIGGMGPEHIQNQSAALQAKFILPAITGNIDIEGGQYLPGPPTRFVREPELELSEMVTPEQKAKQLGADRFKLQAWPGFDLIGENVKRVWGVGTYSISAAHALAHAPTAYRTMLTGKPYPVRAAMSIGSNPMVTAANTKLVYRALKSLDFYVVLDWWKTPSAELADYILPPASWVERPYLGSLLGLDNAIMGGEQALPSAIPGEYNHKADYEILRELGIRLGQEQFWPWKTLEEVYDYQLEPRGISFKEFMAKGGFDSPPNEYKKYEKTGFSTPTGKVELYSTILEKLGYDPLPRYGEPGESPISAPELAKEYPLVLTSGGRFLPMYHSEHRQVDSLRRRHPHPLVQINPETARKLKINDGDWVWIESPRGAIRMKCQYFAGIDPRVVHCEHGWWFPELPGGEPWLHGVWESNVNVLMDDNPDRCDKATGGWPLKQALCKIYQCKTY